MADTFQHSDLAAAQPVEKKLEIYLAHSNSLIYFMTVSKPVEVES